MVVLQGTYRHLLFKEPFTHSITILIGFAVLGKSFHTDAAE